MTRTYRFYKDELGWFIDLKYFPFNRAHLAMVAGADVLLEKLAKGETEVTLKISTKWFAAYDNYIARKFKLGLFNGAIYEGETEDLIDYDLFGYNHLWLCAVTLLVFLRYPKKIYFKVVSSNATIAS